METIYKQRAYDGKWMALTRVKKPEDAYVYFTETKQKITLVPDQWIITGVYDYEIELEK